MPRTMWLVVAYDLLEYRHLIDIIANLSSLCGLTWHMVLKKFVIKQVNVWKKVQQELCTSKKNQRNQDKMSSWLLEETESGINLQQQLPSRVIGMWESQFWKCFGNDSTLTECKESHFYSLPFGQAEASIYLGLAYTSPKNVLMSRTDFTVLL